MVKSNWAMSTDLNKAFAKILATAVGAGVPQNEMPEMVLNLTFSLKNGGLLQEPIFMTPLTRKC
jgi:hypothetical protein